MRIAWVTPYLPEPAASGGAIRQQRLAAALARGAQLHLFARGELWELPRIRSHELDFFATCWLGRDYPPPWLARAPQHAPPPKRVRRGSPGSLWRAVARAHSRTPFDGIIVSHSWAALGAQTLGLPWLLDEHNIESRFFAGVSRSSTPGAQPVTNELAAFERWERKVWGEASALTCVSEDDAAFVTPHRDTDTGPLRPPLVVHNGADLARLQLAAPSTRQGGALFVGSLHHRPNLAAALRLIERIMPRVWQALPDLPLRIVGGPVPTALSRAARNVRGPVQLLGRVADVAPHLLGERVFVNPVIHGAGSSLKTIEALAAGIPLVSTALGARGFSLIPGRHYLRAESDPDFADGIVRIIQGNGVGALSPSDRAHVALFDWQALGARFAAHALTTFERERNARRH